VDHAVGESAFPEIARHRSSDFIPEGLTAFSVNRVIAENRERARFGRDQDEYSVPVACFEHFEPGKLSPSGGNGIGNRPALNDDAEFARG
jgi:hypothetical protein